MVVYVHHAHNHGAARIERQLLEAPSFIEATHAVIERMRDHANAANGLGCAQGGFERKPQEVRGVALSLIILVYGELAEQYGRHGIGAVALLRLGKERAFDVRSAQSDVTYDAPRRRVGDDTHARDIIGLIEPGMATKPVVERVPPAIEEITVVIFGQRARRRRRHDVQRSQDGERRASSASAGIGSAGRLIHASNASQSLAGIVMTPR